MKSTGVVNHYYFGKDLQTFINGIEEGQTGTDDITWEVSTKMNLGVDLELLKGLINLQVDVFHESRDGILIQRQDIPTMVGFYGTSPYGNLGKAENKGIDGQLDIKKQFTKDFFLNFKSNLTFARNTIIENDEPIQKYAYQSQKGLSISQPLGLIALGFFKDQDDIDRSPKQSFMTIIRPGDIKYQDVNSDRVIDLYDQVPIGYPRTPEIMFGFGATLVYKNFDASLFFTGAAHTSFILGGRTMSPFYEGESNILREYYDNRWIPGADNTNAKYPAVINENNENNFIPDVTSTLWLRNGNYLRLKNAEIGYTVPQHICKSLSIASIRFFLNGMNLATWDKLKIVDPESNDGDGDYPIQRNINVGFNVKF